MKACRTCGAEFEPTPGQAKHHDWQCTICRRAYHARWRAVQPPGEVARRSREWQHANPDKKAGYQDVFRHGEKARGARVRLLAEQGGCCAICRVPGVEMALGLALDHDHKTGALRGMLCHKCNLAIGLLADDPARLDAAAAYLRYHQAVPVSC